MNNTLRNAVKLFFLSAVLLILIAGAFAVGFGSAYLMAEHDVLSAQPTLTPPTPTLSEEQGQQEEEGAAPTPTLIPTPTPGAGANEDEETFQLFWEAWDRVQQHFYGELPDMQELTYGAIRGMLSALDDEYTYFVEPEVASMMAEDATGEFQGIGAWVDMDEQGKLELVGIFENSPAEQAGLLAGDRVLAVDGISVVGSTLYEAIGLIRGPEGSEVTLLIEREEVAEPFEVTVTRARLEIPTTEWEMYDNGIGYIKLYDFQTTVTSERVEECLEELLPQEPKGIIFDLRGNSGGLLQQAQQVTDLFVEDGKVLVERWNDGSERAPETAPGDLGEDVPLVVLVDRGTASAAEIVAGALQDHERAILIGETTFGKGVVQLVLTLSDGSELMVTSAQWFTPDGRAIHGKGLAPDIEVNWPEEGVEPDEDPQLERAIEYLLEEN